MAGSTKITTDIPSELAAKLHELVPWGMRKHLMTAVLETILKAIETDGEIVMGAIMARQFKLQWTGEPSGTVQNSDRSRGKRT